MALTIPCESPKLVSIDEYVDYIESNVDLRDLDSIAASAPMLRALANDRTLVVRKLNEQVENSFGKAFIPSAQSVLLGKGAEFYVRAAIWPSTADVAGGRLYQERFAYHLAHDHNFTFLTVNYAGPGYETDIYEYDYDKVTGHVGEAVDIQFLEKVRFGQGSVMMYRAGRDLHIQYPPRELTVTLNLMISLPETRLRDQLYFDVARKVISGYPVELDSTNRMTLVKLAGYVGNEESKGLLAELAAQHPCRRTRLATYEALAVRDPASAATTWEMAAKDPEQLVAAEARKKLALLDNR